MFAVLLLGQVPTSLGLIDAFRRRVEGATTVTVTVIRSYEEFEKAATTRWWWRRGGYYRYVDASGTLIASPEKCWAYKPAGGSYKTYPGAEENWSIIKETGLGEFGPPGHFPPIGSPVRTTWHGRAAWKVEVDGRKLTKETKMYFIFDPVTGNHIGTSANLGSVTQIREFKDLKIDPRIDPSMFTFIPPKGWRHVQ